MMAFHQDVDVEIYLLTIMNMVSALYLDPTIGNFINIVVVRIILVEEEDAEVSTLQLKPIRIDFAINVRYYYLAERFLRVSVSVPSWTSQ